LTEADPKHKTTAGLKMKEIDEMDKHELYSFAKEHADIVRQDLDVRISRRAGEGRVRKGIVPRDKS
jgi:hypothetical protein